MCYMLPIVNDILLPLLLLSLLLFFLCFFSKVLLPLMVFHLKLDFAFHFIHISQVIFTRIYSV